ncbi:MAG TPA: DUF6714 family protein [Kofleriaceae bacterium]
MSEAASEPSRAAFLALLGRAYEEPAQRGLLRKHLGVGSGMLPWDLRQETIADFLEATIEASEEDVRIRLRSMLTELGWRTSRMPDRVIRALGIAERRNALLAEIVAAFPVAPLEGCVIREAYLRDEQGFRVVHPDEYKQAREEAVTTSWRAVPADEIDFAFSKNSVYIWLDEEALSFYLPACLSHALHVAGDCEFYTFLYFAGTTHAAALHRWTADQCRAIAGFMAFVVDDVPERRVIADNRPNVGTWLAARADG